MRDTSLIISFTGMDGAGKTTTINALMQALQRKGITSTQVYLGRGRNNILPIQRAGRVIKQRTEDTPKKPGNHQGFSFIRTLSAPIFALDVWLCQYKVVKPLKKKYAIVFTDRHSTDILLMKGVPMWFKRFLYVFFPKPELTIYLYNDVHTLHARKGHPLHDLQRQEKLFQKINRITKPKRIKTDNLPDSVEKLVDVILKSL